MVTGEVSDSEAMLRSFLVVDVPRIGIAATKGVNRIISNRSATRWRAPGVRHCLAPDAFRISEYLIPLTYPLAAGT
jgi:hypothetical protein